MFDSSWCMQFALLIGNPNAGLLHIAPQASGDKAWALGPACEGCAQSSSRWLPADEDCAGAQPADAAGDGHLPPAGRLATGMQLPPWGFPQSAATQPTAAQPCCWIPAAPHSVHKPADSCLGPDAPAFVAGFNIRNLPRSQNALAGMLQRQGYLGCTCASTPFTPWSGPGDAMPHEHLIP